MPETLLPCVEIEPKVPAAAAVIWLHGLGADGHDFEPIVPYLGLDEALGVRFVFPHAPRRPVTVNMGLVMPAWYDISEIDLERGHDEAGILESAGHLRSLIRRENERGIDSRRIVVAGFSQGGAIALHTGLRYEEPLAGILALSTYVILSDRLEAERHPANFDVPIFQAHGIHDPMVPFERGRQAHALLERLGYAVDWHTYPMGHEVCPDEIQAVGNWLRRTLAR